MSWRLFVLLTPSLAPPLPFLVPRPRQVPLPSSHLQTPLCSPSLLAQRAHPLFLPSLPREPGSPQSVPSSVRFRGQQQAAPLLPPLAVAEAVEQALPIDQ